MTVVGALASLATAAAIGYGALALTWPAPAAAGWARLARFGLAAGLGLGITSVLYFVWLVVVGPVAVGLWAVEVVLAAGSMVLVWRRGGGDNDRDNDKDKDKDKDGEEAGAWEVGGGASAVAGRVKLGLAAVLVLLAVHWVISFVALSRASPHGRWDAWTIWNLRARFLFRSGAEWETVFSPLLAWTHLDYPLLVPGAIARLWTEMGSDPALGSILVAGGFGLATATLLVATLGHLRGPGQGLAAGAFLLATEAFVGQSAAQNADVPLGFFYLATLCAVALGLRYPERRHGALVLADTAAGLGAWTKNEGFVFIAALVLVWVVVALRSRDRRTRLSELAALGAGMVPVLLVVVGFKMALAPPNDILASMDTAGAFDRLTDPERLFYVLTRFASGFIGYGGWAVSAPALLTLYGLLAGVGSRLGDPGLAGAPAGARGRIAGLGGGATGARGRIAATVAAMYLAYLLVYVVTPHDVIWHLDTSLRRLLQQLWPSALLAFFLFVRSPEEVVARLGRPGPAGAET